MVKIFPNFPQCGTSKLTHFLFFTLQEEPNGWVPYKYEIVFNPKPPNPKNHDFVTILPAPFLQHHYRQLVYIVGDTRNYLTKGKTFLKVTIHSVENSSFLHFEFSKT